MKTPWCFKKVVIIIFIIFSFFPGFSQDSRITYLSGVVNVLRDNERIDGFIGLELFKDDRIETKANSMLIFELIDIGEIKMRENTSLSLDSLGRDSVVSLKFGGVFSKLRTLGTGSYSVKAQSMVAGVRGTEFFVAYGKIIEENPDIWLCVNEGAVEVGIENQQDSVIVKEGEGINILSGNKITKPKFYPWTKDLNWNTDPKKGAVVDDTNLDQAYSDLLNLDYD